MTGGLLEEEVEYNWAGLGGCGQHTSDECQAVAQLLAPGGGRAVHPPAPLAMQALTHWLVLCR